MPPRKKKITKEDAERIEKQPVTSGSNMPGLNPADFPSLDSQGPEINKPKNIQYFAEYGTTGLYRMGPYVYEEWLEALQLQKGVKIYKEMWQNDAIISSIIYAIEMVCRSVDWDFEPGGDSPEDEQAAEFFSQCLFEDMSVNWEDTLSEILSMIIFGWSLLELVYKTRNGPNPEDPTMDSNFDDGRIGWRKWGIRTQESLLRWDFDVNGGVTAMVQLAPPHFRITEIPMEKSLLFRVRPRKGNPEGQPIELNTPVPTPDGWKTIGQLVAGDCIYGSDGQIRNVIGKSEVFHNRPLYKLTFSSGDEVTADEVHEWSVTTFNDRVTDRTPRICNSKELYDRINAPLKNMSFCAGVVPEIEGEEAELPIDPYILGYWLGDGASTKAEIAVSDEDLESLKSELLKAGFEIGGRWTNALGVRGLHKPLRLAGLLGKKRIPEKYLRASYSQRLALLQGLMDSDGYSNNEKNRNSCFCNNDVVLLKQVKELIFSLGGRPKLSKHGNPGDLGGIVRGRQITQRKPDYKLSFYLHKPLHRLPRKLAQQNIKDTLKVRGQFIQKVERVGTGDTACIETDSPDNLFLVGEGFIPTHNSLLRGAYRSWMIKKNIEDIEAIGVERDLAGIPIMRVPENVLLGSDADAVSARDYYKQVITNIHRNQDEGIILPSTLYPPEDGGPGLMYDIQLLGPSSQRQFMTGDIINRYNKMIAMTVLADFLMLGQDQTGSYALAETRNDIFSLSITAILDSIAETINSYAVPRLARLNANINPQSLPKLTHGDIASSAGLDIANAISLLARGGVTIPDTVDFRNKIWNILHLPTEPEPEDAEVKPPADSLLPGQTAAPPQQTAADAMLPGQTAADTTERQQRLNVETPATSEYGSQAKSGQPSAGDVHVNAPPPEKKKRKAKR